MDRIIQTYDYKRIGDLSYCQEKGLAYQTKMRDSVKYDKNYFNKCLSYKNSDIAKKINSSRVKLVRKYITSPVLDIGIGSGEFIETYGRNAFGYDINPEAVGYLKSRGIYNGSLDMFQAITFWDALEHVINPEAYFRKIQPGTFVFVSIPIFKNLEEITESKHYRPNEHYYYFTKQGFIDWMSTYNFKLKELNKNEIDAGRESIQTFVFQKMDESWHYNISQYISKHFESHYGSSSDLYLNHISRLVFKKNPKTIIDYGCGRSDLIAYFYNDGKRELYKYDPAIPEFKDLAKIKYDLVLCNDVLEHIAVKDLERILLEIKCLSENVIFTISIVPARAKLPDGRNAHITLLTESEWIRLVSRYFNNIKLKNSGYGNILLLTNI